MVNCFVLGSGDIFNFEIGAYQNFTQLRKAIWDDNKDYFERIEVDDQELKLWKVEIYTRNSEKYLEIKNSQINVDIKQKFGGLKLEPTWKVTKEFPEPPPTKEHIHIIVQPSPPPPRVSDNFAILFSI